jgi:hypothetical protein
VAGGVWFVPWSDVRDVADVVRVGSRAADWERLEDIPDRTGGSADR